MGMHLLTTPVGRRTVMLARFAKQAIATANAPEHAVHKRNNPRDISAARARIGVSERLLAALSAHLILHHEATPAGQGNIEAIPLAENLKQLTCGIAESTLGLHFWAPIYHSLIIRRSSPNYKRHALKGQGSEEASGFDLSPLVASDAEFHSLCQAGGRAPWSPLLREQMILCSRGILKLTAAGISLIQANSQRTKSHSRKSQRHFAIALKGDFPQPRSRADSAPSPNTQQRRSGTTSTPHSTRLHSGRCFRWRVMEPITAEMTP